MKKILAIILTAAMISGLCACGVQPSSKDISELKTLNEILSSGYEATGNTLDENVYVQNVTDNKGTEYYVVVKATEEQVEALNAIDYLDEDSQNQIINIIGDNEIAEAFSENNFMPGKDVLDTYKGMSIAEFEMNGFEMMGYSGSDGKYSFDFDDSSCYYFVQLEDGTKLDDLGSIEAFDAAIQDYKIKSVECGGLTPVFISEYLAQFYDAPEKAIPKEMGETKSSLDEINTIVGSSIQPAAGAAEEKFSVIDGKIAQYIYKINDLYYAIRSSADMTIDLTDDNFEEDPIIDEQGYCTTNFKQTDDIYGVRFAFNNYQYAYIVYDGEMDYMTFDAMQSEYKDSICAYPEGSAYKAVLGTYASEDGYAMSVSPVSDNSVQFSAYTFDETQTTMWTIIAGCNGNSFSYEKSRIEIYKGEEYTTDEAGSGVITMDGDTLTWDGHILKKQ